MMVVLESAQGEALRASCAGRDERAVAEEFCAQVYAPDGRRVGARLRMEGDVARGQGEMPVFCEAGLEGCARAYALERCQAQARAALRREECMWRAEEGGAATGLELRPLAHGEEWLVRGVYALAAQARQCTVRSTRAVWDALMARWAELELRAYVVERAGRAVGYALLGARGEQGYEELYECAALPDDGPGLCDVLAAACEAGVCASRGRVVGSRIELDELEAGQDVGQDAGQNAGHVH